MLETARLSQKMSKDDFRNEILPLKEKLGVLQHDVKNSGLPVMVVFEGWSTAGKGCVLSDVILTLDPRNFKTKNTLPANCVEVRKPFLWRHWLDIPTDGQIVFYDKSWYQEISVDRVEKKLSKQTLANRLNAINLFERQMIDDGTLLLKFFLHISQKEQKKRLDNLASKKSTAWRVEKNDYKRLKNYDAFYTAYDQMLTQTQDVPWHIVNSTDERAALADVYRIITAAIEHALAQKTAAAKAKPTRQSKKVALHSGPFTLVQMPLLQEVSLDKQLSREEYKTELDKAQQKLKKLHNHIYQEKIPVIIAYEGWDAAGKGGNIKRLTSSLDPRGYEVIPIAAPTPAEAARQYLWRFWQALQKDGHVSIFDRTWYGRVLVERVEGFTAEDAWRRAYREINEFEGQLTEWGAVVLKFWMQIDKDEQLRRFEARQNTPEKTWKLTDEDWRNREKWDLYEQAVNDMIRLTSTDTAPWTIVESEDKLYGRIKVLHTVIDAIERRL